ncbi:uncharacterized protein PGTG_09831 [Puccinia graminis f. sp. tritici CRL 75-36-700-3]|uniref:Tet-like 2OG-Fe(II) oxygenase domain-containing protein n=1 Tax=Puccinia graminis f. sp. tritici (strain CRL 75-36-700-3 / race SCCL) TaxID=418459 RepID=E3KF32_PUCGT|nr:uncharacterized protein PGTG_09831 [Puccinia graminis f. sp. tritici CRL 75-36-700-3]EFP82863.1 hypothetical protein PGTG_09831 [Puccinia graminis f. sp. tritici CRL 75-36-700-3]
MTALRKAYLAERKRKNRSKKHAEEQTSELSLTLDDTERRHTITNRNSINHHGDKRPVVEPIDRAIHARQDKITWSSKRYIKLELFPHMLGNNPDRLPTNAKFEYCNNLIKNFRLFNHGKVVIHDKKDKSKIIALIEFTPFDEMTPNGLADINYITRFLHSDKQFVNAVGSETRSWGGRMFAIGWRKAMVGFPLIGLYRNKAAIDRSPQAYESLMKKSEQASSILGRFFRQLANVAFADNQEVMNQNSIPSIGQPDFGIPLGDDNCAPNLTFTSDDFFNPPHCDTEDLSEFAFGLFTPVNKGDWSLPNTRQFSPIPGRTFVFPDYRCGIDLSKNNGVVKMVWRAKDVRHCTIYLANTSIYNQIGMSLQINKKTAKTSHDIKSGSIYERPAYKDVPKDKLYIGNVQHYVKGLL